ncbi:MAG: YtxH domain-containing protein [Candidatus Dojkabacteria bacterium]
MHHKNHSCNNNGMSFMSGLLVGGMIGAFIGILVAPEPGERSRKKLKKASDKLLKQGIDAFDQFQEDQIEPFLDKVSERASDVRGDLAERIESAKDDLLGTPPAKSKPKPTAKQTKPLADKP